MKRAIPTIKIILISFIFITTLLFFLRLFDYYLHVILNLISFALLTFTLSYDATIKQDVKHAKNLLIISISIVIIIILLIIANVF